MAHVSLGSRLVPSLLAADLQATIDFYRTLGFAVIGCQPDASNPSWVELRRDGVTIQFYAEAPEGTAERPVCSGTLYFYPDDVDALAEELRGTVEFAWGPETMGYGMREFGIRDPNGYFLAFTEPA